MLIVGFQDTKRTLRSQTLDSLAHLERCAVCITIIIRVLSNLKKFRCNILGNVYAIKEGIETSLRLHLLSSELNVSRTHVLNVLNRYNSATQRLLFDDRSDLITDTSSCLISSNSSEALSTSSTTLALTSRYLTGESNTTRPCGLPRTPLNRCNTVVVGIQSSAGGNKVTLNSRTLECGKRLGVYPVIRLRNKFDVTNKGKHVKWVDILQCRSIRLVNQNNISVWQGDQITSLSDVL